MPANALVFPRNENVFAPVMLTFAVPAPVQTPVDSRVPLTLSAAVPFTANVPGWLAEKANVPPLRSNFPTESGVGVDSVPASRLNTPKLRSEFAVSVPLPRLVKTLALLMPSTTESVNV